MTPSGIEPETFRLVAQRRTSQHQSASTKHKAATDVGGGVIDGIGARSSPLLPTAIILSSPKLISIPAQSACHNADYVWSLLPTYV